MDFGRLITAMITPFTESLEVDYREVDRIVDHLIAQGNDALVVAGTTGESPTLSFDEKIKLFHRVVVRADKKIKIIAGTGSNDTSESIRLSQLAAELGVDGIMLVVPYYNKPSQEGLYNHFKLIAESVDLPIMLYNVPGRTAVNMCVDTVVKLSKIDNIVAIKEASGNICQVNNIIRATGDDFLVYSGDDSLTLAIMAIGGHGIVSVAGHVVGREIKSMIEDYLAGRVREAAKKQALLLPVFEAMFITSNPVPVKVAMLIDGYKATSVRPPLLEASNQERDFIKNAIEKFRDIVG